MAMSSRRYQGYPYVDPPVTDVPSISADDAARWQHLPRRQIEVKRDAPPTDIPLQDRSRLPQSAKNESEETPVVYIDLPEENEASSSIVATVTRRSSKEHDFEVISNPRTNDKKDLDAPVVYIDLPEAGGNGVSTRENTPQEEEPAFVEDTIFYDPFENRRIDHSKPARDESDDESEVSSHRRVFQMPTRRPNHLDLQQAGTSAGPLSYPSQSSLISSLMSKEADIYGQDRFPASPIPVSQFPQPPPAYAEIDALSSPVVEQPVVEQPRPNSPPKTLVILPHENTSAVTPPPIGIPNSNRKYLNCHHCGMRVHTLVIKETGRVTHAIALFCCLISCLPAVFCIYCTDFLKVKNHYCPNCNNIIGYQQPMSGNNIVYVNT